MKTEYDCVIVGAGPAGLAAAAALSRLGIGPVLVLERGPRPGGILNQCVHAGFGLSYYGEELTGPEYARRLEAAFSGSGAELALGASVLEVTRSRAVRLLSRAEGYRELRARSVIVATGCRERTRDNIEVAGTRPAGVFTAGQAQDLVNLRGFRVGKRAVIQGSGDIGLIMARRLAVEGCEIAGVYERLPYLSGLPRNKVQCLDHFGIPLAFRTQVREILGRRRVEGAVLERLDESLRPIPGAIEKVECDTLLFSVGLIPEVDILKGAGLHPAAGPTPSIPVDSNFEASRTGIFVCGNALHIHDLADNASREGEAVAARVEAFLRRPEEFLSARNEAPPYAPRQADPSRDEAFFERLEREGAEVCIVCPRSCVVSASSAGCPRGAVYFAESRQCRSQVFTSTIGMGPDGTRPRAAIRSREPVPVRAFPGLKAALASARRDGGGALALRFEGKEWPLEVST